MPEQLVPENLHPVHQAALRHLLAIHEPINETMLYALQLAAWALENDLLVVDDRYNPELPDQAMMMLSWRPENAHGFLAGDDQEWNLRPEIIEDASPAGAAAYILEVLNQQLLARVPGWTGVLAGG